MSKYFKLFLSVIGLVFVLTTLFPRPANAVGLYFGGKILASQARVCNIMAGPIPIPVPMQVLYLGPPTYRTVEYIWYAPILQAFGVTTSIYNFGQFYRKGPNVIGQYVPVPIPWVNCEFHPTNIITKIGTSLF